MQHYLWQVEVNYKVADDPMLLHLLVLLHLMPLLTGYIDPRFFIIKSLWPVPQSLALAHGSSELIT